MIALLVAALLIQDPQTEERLKKLEKEIEELKKTPEVKHPGPQPGQGSRIHLFGYGEAHYNNPRPDVMTQDARSIAEIHRAVIGLGIEFTDWLEASLEVDFEHSFREPEVEFINVDFKLSQAVIVRAGMPLMPVGSLNEFHEPTKFYSVERPQFHTLIVPTTWQEVGAGILGTLPFDEVSVRYRLYGVFGGDPTTFRPTNGVRGFRTKGRDDRSFADGGAVTGRVEIQPAAWCTFGISGYAGHLVRHDIGLSNVRTNLFIGTADLTLQGFGFELHVEGGQICVDNADRVTAALAAANRPVASVMDGLYAELAYDILRNFPETDMRLVVFVRYELIDTQAQIPTGFLRAQGNRRDVHTFGVAFYPIANVVIKVDHEIWIDNRDKYLGRFNVGIGYEFHP